LAEPPPRTARDGCRRAPRRPSDPRRPRRGPVRVFASDADDSAIAEAVRAALDESETTRAGDADPRAFERALEDAGLEQADLAGGAGVTIGQTTKGELEVQACKPVRGASQPAGPRETVADGDAAAAVASARRAMAKIRTRHRRPGATT
jgi:hypothetical protein